MLGGGPISNWSTAVLGTRAIMVLAHQSCGAVKAAVGGQAVPGQISALYAPLQQAVSRKSNRQNCRRVAE